MTLAKTHLHQAYVLAQERYAVLGVNTKQALAQPARTPLSLHCWQAAFDTPASARYNAAVNQQEQPTCSSTDFHNQRLGEPVCLIPIVPSPFYF